MHISVQGGSHAPSAQGAPQVLAGVLLTRNTARSSGGLGSAPSGPPPSWTSVLAQTLGRIVNNQFSCHSGKSKSFSKCVPGNQAVTDFTTPQLCVHRSRASPHRHSQQPAGGRACRGRVLAAAMLQFTTLPSRPLTSTTRTQQSHTLIPHTGLDKDLD